MNWTLPNQLTVARIVISGAFFVLLALYEPPGVPAILPGGGGPSGGGSGLLNGALVLYLVAGATDILDGHLARKMNLVSAFGRIADPFVDKVLVVGAFAMLAGSNYALVHAGDPQALEAKLPGWFTGGMASAVQAWMVVVILGREFIVSAMRGYNESQGIKFPATPAGKIKMFVQSLAICAVLFQMANLPKVAWAIYSKVALVWLATVVTVLSGLAYVTGARSLFWGPRRDTPQQGASQDPT
jgi:phosphatidylglycerophosphate synthase